MSEVHRRWQPRGQLLNQRARASGSHAASINARDVRRRSGAGTVRIIRRTQAPSSWGEGVGELGGNVGELGGCAGPGVGQGAGNHADRPVGPPGRESDPSRNVYGRDRTNTLNRAPGRPRSGGYPALAWGAQPLTRVVPSQELHRWSRQACSHNNAPPRISAHPSHVSCPPARELRPSSSSSWSQRVFSRG